MRINATSATALDLDFAAACRGPQEEATHADLDIIIRDEIAHRLNKGEILPSAFVRTTRDFDFAAA
jgi:hypothetical protein